MFNKIKRKIALEKASADKKDLLIKKFEEAEYGSDEYYSAMTDLKKLQDLTGDTKGKRKIDSSVAVALITTVGGLIGTILILDYEEKGGIVTTSAKNIVNKLGR